jgi:hypothetical protein
MNVLSHAKRGRRVAYPLPFLQRVGASPRLAISPIRFILRLIPDISPRNCSAGAAL